MVLGRKVRRMSQKPFGLRFMLNLLDRVHLRFRFVVSQKPFGLRFMLNLRRTTSWTQRSSIGSQKPFGLRFMLNLAWRGMFGEIRGVSKAFRLAVHVEQKRLFCQYSSRSSCVSKAFRLAVHVEQRCRRTALRAA